MTEQPAGPHCGNNPNFKMSDGDRKAVDDFKARLALQASAKPYIDSAAWVDGDPLMEVVAVTLWEHCETGDGGIVHDDPRTIAAFAAAVARAHAAVPSAPADRAAEERLSRVHEWVTSEVVTAQTEFGNGYRAAQRDIRDLIKGRFDNDAANELRRVADEAQQPVCPTPESHNWGCGCPGDRLPLYSDRGVDTPGCDCGHTGMGMRWHDGVGCAWFKRLTEEGRRLLVDDPADEAQQPETQAENPARIDRLRPEFTDHASVESIDAQLRRARSQLRRWHLRVEWLISLRQARVEQKERGEWPAVEAQQPKEA